MKHIFHLLLFFSCVSVVHGVPAPRVEVRFHVVCEFVNSHGAEILVNHHGISEEAVEGQRCLRRPSGILNGEFLAANQAIVSLKEAPTGYSRITDAFHKATSINTGSSHVEQWGYIARAQEEDSMQKLFVTEKGIETSFLPADIIFGREKFRRMQQVFFENRTYMATKEGKRIKIQLTEFALYCLSPGAQSSGIFSNANASQCRPYPVLVDPRRGTPVASVEFLEAQIR